MGVFSFMATCGTVAGYHAHYRQTKKTGEKVECRPCLDAVAEDMAQKRLDAKARAASSMAEAIETEPDVDEGIDELEEARQNLRLVRAAMRNSSPRDMASLSKRREELAELIKRLEADQAVANGEKVSRIDQLANRRAQRLAKTAN